MRVVIADLKGRGGFVNKDTVVGGYGSRFRGFSWTTRWIERARKLYQNVPSIHAGYLAAIFAQAGQDNQRRRSPPGTDQGGTDHPAQHDQADDSHSWPPEDAVPAPAP